MLVFKSFPAIWRWVLLAVGLSFLSGCASVSRRASVVTPGRPTGGTDFDFDQLPEYQADTRVYREAVEGSVAAATAAAVAGTPCPPTVAGAGAANKLAFCTQNGVLVVQVRDTDSKSVNTAANLISIASTPQGVSGATTVAAVAGVATFDKLYVNSPGTYTLTARADGLTPITSDSFTVAVNLDRAKLFRNKIVDKFRGKIDDVYGEYLNVLYTGKGIEGLAADITSLGLTAASTISLVSRTKTILAALATGMTGVGLSVDKNVFGQQTFAALAIAMQARRDLAKSSIIKNEQLSVTDYSLDALRDDLISYFYSGTLTGGLQEIQEEAATKSAAISANSGTSNNGTAGAAAKLAFTQSTSGAVNAPLSFQVQVQDSNGKVVANATNSITISPSSPADVKGSLTASAVAGTGVATFNLTFTSAGSYTLTAKADPLTDATTSINIAPAAGAVGMPAKLAFTPPPSGSVNSPLSIKVQVQDSNGNVVTNATNSITISPSSPADVMGSLTASAVAGTGVATFNLTFTSVGSYTLAAKADGLTDAPITPINIVAVPPAPPPAAAIAPKATQQGLH